MSVWQTLYKCVRGHKVNQHETSYHFAAPDAALAISLLERVTFALALLRLLIRRGSEGWFLAGSRCARHRQDTVQREVRDLILASFVSLLQRIW